MTNDQYKQWQNVKQEKQNLIYITNNKRKSHTSESYHRKTLEYNFF